MRTTKPVPNITSDTISEPYKIEWLDGKKEVKVKVSGIPLEILVGEEEDGEH